MKRDEIKQERVLVLGAARSGIAAAKLLKADGADVTVADEKSREAATEAIAELDAAGIPHAWGGDVQAAIIGVTILVKSPGIPQTSVIVKKAREQGARVISEIEMAAAFASPEARIVAITGTNGKTTTTAWTAHILQHAGYNAVLAGNIGDAWSNTVASSQNQDANTVFVVEVSSFQLEDLEDFHPNIVLMTNFSPDHMDRYDDNVDLYAAAKANVLRNITSSDVFVVNAGDEPSRRFLDQSAAETAWFGRGETAGERTGVGAFEIAGDVSLRTRAGESVPVLPAAQLPLPGAHNLENALAAALIAHLLGAPAEKIREGLMSFRGVEHRIELCGERSDGARFYNDSKATNLDAMEKALKAFGKPIILIAGGRDAHSDYASIAELVQRSVKHMVTIGEAAELLESAWGSVPHERASSMEDAVRKAAAYAEPGDVVVFSPACKSFDMYNNFEERGSDFRQQVKVLLAAG